MSMSALSSLSPSPRRTDGGGRSTASLSAAASSSAGAGIDPALEERLSSLLASPNFSVSRYLNLALAPPQAAAEDDGDAASKSDGASAEERAEQRLEQRMASLALQLQMRTQSCHDEIGRIGAELQAVVPRCAADVGRLRVGLEGIELDVRGLLEGMDDGGGDGARRRRGGKVGDDAGVGAADAGAGRVVAAPSAAGRGGDGPLGTLHCLLNLRTHLATSRAILSAASSWDETINSIPLLLSSTPPNLVEAVAALSQLERGARALRGMPEGRDERDAALAKLRTQLEALLKPQLLHALRRMDTRLGPLQQCVGMYRELGKTGVLREEYVRMRPSEVHTLWFSFGGSGTDGDGGEAKDGEGGDGEGGAGGDDGSAGDDREEVEDFDFDEPAEEEPDAAVPPPADATQRRRATARQFMEFLPSFYEAVLELLSKERTQSKIVFGPDMTPAVVVRVLIECFRPIIDSFEKRLENLCPPPGEGGGGSAADGGAGGAEAVAAAYEASVQFLSLAYEQIEAWGVPPPGEGGEGPDGGDMSAIRDDPHDGGEAPLWSVLRSALRLIASPFLRYQRDLAGMERGPMLAAASMVAKDVRGVVNFEDAAERLGDLAPFMFPLVEGEFRLSLT